MEIYMAYVVSKLMYSLETIWLLKNERAKLDAFHVKCLRKIFGIPPSFVSRISNAEVLETAAAPLLSEILASRQAKLYKRLQDQPQQSFARRLVCTETGEPRVWHVKRRRGRPRQMWAHSVHKMMASSLPPARPRQQAASS